MTTETYTLEQFIADLDRITRREQPAAAITEEISPLLARLVKNPESIAAQYRRRVGEVRVFYDVTPEAVEVLAIVTKAEAARWLAEHGTPGAPGSAG